MERRSWEAHLRNHLLSAACAFLAIVGAAGSAGAQERGPWLAHAEGSRLAFETDWFPSEHLHTFTWGIAGQIRLTGPVYLDLDVPWAGLFPDGGDARFVFGNPTIGAHWADKVSRNVAVFAGGTLTIPTLITSDSSFDGDTFEDVLLRGLAGVTRAYVDLHRFLPDYIFVRPRGGVEVRFASVLRYRGDLTPMLLIPVGDVADDAEVVIEHGSEFEARSDAGVGGGLRLQFAVLATELDDDDIFQSALEPYFTYDPMEGFYARIGSLIALDRDLGFGLNKGKLATFRVALGGKW
jgi:hypothetical protein